MARTKISEFSATPASNTDIDSINISEGCAPSGINDAIRELMSQLKDFQTGAVGDSFNGPVGTTTAAAGAFTTLAASGAVTLSGGTANGVTYLNGSKVLTSGSALTFDGTNLNTTGNFQIGGTKMLSKITGDSYIWNNTSALNFVSSDGNTVQLKLDSSGNLGLGVTPSAWSGMKAFQLGDGTFAMSSDGAGAGDGSLTWNGYYNGTNWIYGYTGGGSSRYRQTELGHAWFYAASGTAGNAITFTQAMTLDANSNLIVNDTAVQYSSKLYVNGAFAARNGGVDGTYADAFTAGYNGNYNEKNVIQTQVGGASGFRFKTSNGGGSASTTTTLDLAINGTIFYINGSEKARIDSSGNLLVGTTNSAENAGAGFKLLTSGQVACITTANTTNAQMSTYELYSTGASAFRFYVGAGGTIFATSTTITAISDKRLKENVRDLDDGLDVVMALKPRKFDWKEGKGANIKNARGFIAQEFETVLPDMIETWRDPAPEGEEPYKAINANLIPTLVKAIQEQQAIIESLKARLDAANL